VKPGTVLIFAIHRSEQWWRYLGRNLGYERSFILSDLRGEGDRNLIEPFYAAYRRLRRSGAAETEIFSRDEIDDIIGRCRVLRWLASEKATAMVLAMGEAIDAVLDEVRPVAATSWPIDRYIIDILERLCARRGIPYYELTASAAPGMAMLLHRGRLVAREQEPDSAAIDETVRELADPLFTPAYVRNQASFRPARWLKIFGYFRLRSWAFRTIGMLRRDPLNCHYLDAQSFLGHKPRLSDIRVMSMLDSDWRARIEAFPRERRLLIGLQLFPEASIDYWVRERSLIDYEDVIVEVAQAFGRAGFIIVVKDHPLQFGFRQMGLLKRLAANPAVVMVPYHVSGNELLSVVGVNFTLTGTLGLQAALLGLTSVTAPTYYTTKEDFVLLERRADIVDLPRQVLEAGPTDLRTRQRRIVSKLLRGSFPGDFFSFRAFDESAAGGQVAQLGAALGDAMTALGPEQEDWHGRHPWT
jgi:hypothetical protein